jgi:putative NADH-flavin reductase
MAFAVATQSAEAKTIVVYGASGNIGQIIVTEALNRGHTVIGVSREPAKLKINHNSFKAVAGDATNLESFKKVTQGADAVIVSVGGGGEDGVSKNTTHAQAARIAVQAFTGASNNPEVIQIGGATTLYKTVAEMEANLPPNIKAGTPFYTMVFGHLDALQTYQASKIRWSVLTPPQSIEGYAMGKPPELKRTGKYRTSTDGPVMDAGGKNVINMADLAVAAVDEAESGRFIGKRFTVGY